MAAPHEDESRPQVKSDADIEVLLDGLAGPERSDRADLIAWLLDRDFTADQIGATLTPMMLPANRVMGDNGVYVSTREMSQLAGIDLQLLQQLMRAAGLPRIGDLDAAVVPWADAEAVARAKYLIDIGLDPGEAVAAVKVLTEGARRVAAIMREPAFRLVVKPGASEIDFAQAAEALALATVPFAGKLVAGLLLAQYRHIFETRGDQCRRAHRRSAPRRASRRRQLRRPCRLHAARRDTSARTTRGSCQPVGRTRPRHRGLPRVVRQDHW
jgi:adenylate cyclase